MPSYCSTLQCNIPDKLAERSIFSHPLPTGDDPQTFGAWSSDGEKTPTLKQRHQLLNLDTDVYRTRIEVPPFRVVNLRGFTPPAFIRRTGTERSFASRKQYNRRLSAVHSVPSRSKTWIRGIVVKTVSGWDRSCVIVWVNVLPHWNLLAMVFCV